ncbi:heme/hemin ABC transporter substrate-binding protein [Psychrobacter sp. I-STPA10]|uniref:heme/hemin ABC transporter substrate-binding protein n=1 Tax=Psychrobacter sp. I-STPA10 TaxID=2585769 RepID=UPI001E49E35E|nr:ABC transporter substrate-binding protein [Psychrobacter sp. I-STPA10]
MTITFMVTQEKSIPPRQSLKPVHLVKKAAVCAAVMVLTSLSTVSASAAYDRIVALSPDVADILVGLNSQDKVVGKNAFNENPALASVPEVGSHRNITAESVIAVKPDLVLGSYMVQPASIYARLNKLNIKAVNVAPKEDINTYAKSIELVGNYVGKSIHAKRMSRTWLGKMQAKPSTGTRYLLSYDGRIVAGKGTVGDELIKRAGGINAAANVSGLKPLSREGWIAAAPDVIIIADHNKPIVGSVAEFSQRPEIKDTQAAKNKNIYFWPVNDFLRYGLTSPDIVNRLNQLSK